MGTIMNGEKIENVYICGNIVNGFAKNGQTIFKKEQTENEKYIYINTVVNGLENIEITQAFLEFTKFGYTKITFTIKNNSDLKQEPFNYICELNTTSGAIYVVKGTCNVVIPAHSGVNVESRISDNLLNVKNFTIRVDT